MTERTRRGRPLVVTAVLAAIVFALLAIDAVRATSSGWDRGLFRALYSGETPWPQGGAPREHPLFTEFDPVFSLARDRRAFIVLFAATVVVLGVNRCGRALAFFLVSLGIVAINPLLKSAFGRPSPFEVPGEYSFPSGHATGSMAVAVAIVVLAFPTRLRWPAIAGAVVWVFCVAVPSIADGGHWPSDVLGGWMIAIVWIVIVGAGVSMITSRSRRDAETGARP